MQLLDARKYNVLDLSSIYKSKTHFICAEIEATYLQEAFALLERVEHKREIIDQSLIKFADKIGFVVSKSSDSIAKFALT